MSVGEMEAEYTELKAMNAKPLRDMGMRCKNSADYFTDMLQKNGNTDMYLSATDAVNHNLADHIGVPVLQTTITVQANIVAESAKRKRRKPQVKVFQHYA